MQLLELFHELTVSPQNAKELKGLILQLAVQGKLTANWREQQKLNGVKVEPASELLKRIHKEKEQLIKEKKIKKEKPLPSVTIEEMPYELPEGWKWSRLVEVCQYIQRGKSPEYAESSKVPVVSQKCVQWSGFDISKARFITEESLEKYGAERFLQQGDLLWNSTGDGTIGRIIEYQGAEYDRIVADSHVTVVRSFKNYVLPGYLWIFTASPKIQFLVAGRVSGSTKQTELGTGTVKELEFAFPPLEEQKAIVEIVESLFKEVEQLEELTVARVQLKEDFATSALIQLTEGNTSQEWQQLQSRFSTFFDNEVNIKKLRKGILQLAVQGKLTENWREEQRLSGVEIEPASELLKRIKREKEQLIKEKKIKKEKPVPPITEEEIPYELPEGWEWTQVLDISMKVTDGEHSTPLRTESGYYLLSARNVTNEGINLDKVDYVGGEEFQRIRKRCDPQKGDVLISCSGSVGRVCLVDKDDEYCMVRSAALVKQNHDNLLGQYLVYSLRAPFVQTQIIEKSRSTAQSNLFLGKIKELVFPLPPLEEQKAIVEKVNQLMAYCDELEERVKQSQVHAEQLMQSVLREVFERKEV